MTTINLEVQGMSCGSCVKRVTQALQPVAGVSGVEVDLQSGHVKVSGDFAQGAGPLVLALTAAGYPTKLAASATATSATKKSGCCCG